MKLGDIHFLNVKGSEGDLNITSPKLLLGKDWPRIQFIAEFMARMKLSGLSREAGINIFKNKRREVNEIMNDLRLIQQFLDKGLKGLINIKKIEKSIK